MLLTIHENENYYLVGQTKRNLVLSKITNKNKCKILCLPVR
jgi:hypothetical protein